MFIISAHLRPTPVPGVEVHGLADHNVVVSSNSGPILVLGAHLQGHYIIKVSYLDSCDNLTSSREGSLGARAMQA